MTLSTKTKVYLGIILVILACIGIGFVSYMYRKKILELWKRLYVEDSSDPTFTKKNSLNPDTTSLDTSLDKNTSKTITQIEPHANPAVSMDTEKSLPVDPISKVEKKEENVAFEKNKKQALDDRSEFFTFLNNFSLEKMPWYREVEYVIHTSTNLLNQLPV